MLSGRTFEITQGCAQALLSLPQCDLHPRSRDLRDPLGRPHFPAFGEWAADLPQERTVESTGAEDGRGHVES